MGRSGRKDYQCHRSPIIDLGGIVQSGMHPGKAGPVRLLLAQYFDDSPIRVLVAYIARPVGGELVQRGLG